MDYLTPRLATVQSTSGDLTVRTSHSVTTAPHMHTRFAAIEHFANRHGLEDWTVACLRADGQEPAEGYDAVYWCLSDHGFDPRFEAYVYVKLEN